jgi:hypothetical protein
MSRIVFVLLFLICSVSVAGAEIIEFDMSGLTGTSADSVITDSLVYNGPPAVINSVSIRVTGEVDDLGAVCCGGPQNCPDGPGPWFMTWYGFLERSGDAVYGKWVASAGEYLSVVAPFDQTGVAESHDGFPSLSDGDVIDVSLYFGKGLWPQGYECDVVRPPHGTKHTVTIIFNVSSTLPAQPATWGRVKTLFN